MQRISNERQWEVSGYAHSHVHTTGFCSYISEVALEASVAGVQKMICKDTMRLKFDRISNAEGICQVSVPVIAQFQQLVRM